MRRGWAGVALLAGAMACAMSAASQTATAAPGTAVAQTDAAPAKAMEFDAVSIKQNKADVNVMYDKTPKDGYAVEHYPLKGVISAAYGIRWDLISGGPGWVDTDYYDINAKVAGEDVATYRKLSKADRNRMVQEILADRFKLAVHIETKELPGYELVVAKGGSKLTDSTHKQQSYGANNGDYNAEAVTMQTLAKLLSQHMQRTVTDKTELTGKYDFNLKWAVERGPTPSAADGGAQATDPAAGPSLFTALEEQLGLKLNSVKGPVDTLVIDHVEKPSEN